MKFNRVFAILLRQFYLIRDNPTRFVQIFLWIAIDITLWGFISRYLNKVSGTGLNFVAIFLGAIVLWDFLSRALHGLSMAFFEDVWSRNFLNFFASPLRISEYLGGMILTSFITTTLGLVMMLLLAGLAFHLSILSLGLPVLLCLIILFAFGIALGIFGLGLILRFGPSAEWFIWPIPVLLAPFVGVYYPTNVLPQWMQVISHVLAPSYIFNVLRAINTGQRWSATNLLWAAVLCILTLLLCYTYFISVYRRAIRTGLIARYSAESVG